MSERMYPGMGQDERTTFAPYSAFEVPADLRQLHGRYDVESTARRVRNFRYAEEWMMMTMAGWLATIPEVPVKTGLGKIIWETAQAADELGKRLPELRCGRRAVTASESANQGFAEFIQAISEPESPDLTIEKLDELIEGLRERAAIGARFAGLLAIENECRFATAQIRSELAQEVCLACTRGPLEDDGLRFGEPRHAQRLEQCLVGGVATDEWSVRRKHCAGARVFHRPSETRPEVVGSGGREVMAWT